jgi:hypothetical protein
MTHPRDQIEELFEATATDPAAWLEHARTMRLAAEPILQRFLEIRETPQVDDGIRLEKLAYVRAYMLLTGIAFENLLKGIAAARGLASARPDFALDQSLSGTRGGHGLTGMAKTLALRLNPAELDYLRRLEEYVVWAGRYPVSKKATDFLAGYRERLLTFTSDDPGTADELFDRLAQLTLICP